MTRWIAFWNILRKDMKTYYLKPPNISWGLIFPFAWTVMFFIKSGGGFTIVDILPGVICMSILFGTTSMLAVTVTFERKGRSFERLLLAPVSLGLLMGAKTSGAIIFGMINALVPLVMASFVIDLGGINWAPIIPGIFLIALSSTFLGLFVAVSVSEVFEAQTFSNFIRFPMIFLCGLFFTHRETAGVSAAVVVPAAPDLWRGHTARRRKRLGQSASLAGLSCFDSVLLRPFCLEPEKRKNQMDLIR